MAKLRRARLLGVLFTVAAALALAGCAPRPASANTGPDSRLDGEWHLLAASDARGRLVLANTWITLTIPPHAEATGRASCSNYTANVIGRPGVVFVDVAHRTTTTCTLPTADATDRRYFAALGATKLASVTATTLTLASARTSLTFERAKPVPVAAFEDIPWGAYSQDFLELGHIEDVEGRYGSLLLSGSHIFELNVGSCPQVSGVWTADAGQVVLEQVKDEKAHCDDVVDASTRDALLITLLGGFEPTVSTKRLRLVNARSISQLNLST